MAPPTLAILAAMPSELGPLVHRLNLTAQGDHWIAEVQGMRLVAVCCGIGARRMEAGLDAVIARHAPQALILAGMSGGLCPELEAGRAVRVRWVVNPEGEGYDLGEAASPPLPVTGAALRDAGRSLVTVKRAVRTPVDKQALGEQARACLVDMETLTVAAAAAKSGLPLTVIRAVSDPVYVTLPPGVLAWLKGDGSPNVAAAMRGLLRRPWILPAVVRLARHSKLAANALADAVASHLALRR